VENQQRAIDYSGKNVELMIYRRICTSAPKLNPASKRADVDRIECIDDSGT
jgi:hypothetical protein